MKNIWQQLPRPIIGLAPMSGITDSAFRQIAKDFGAEIVFSEMISADGLFYGQRKSGRDEYNKTLAIAGFSAKERPIIIQLFGRQPEIMAKAAKIISRKFKPDGIDINMGCPARRLVEAGHGVSLMRDLDLACYIIEIIKKEINLPVSVKTRLGFQSEKEILKFAKSLENCGLDALILHGRTYPQLFRGQVNYQIMKMVKENLKIPLIASGGLYTPEAAIKILEETGADGLIFAKGVLGNPWIISQTINLLKSGQYQRPKKKEIFKIALKQAKLSFKLPRVDAISILKKHLCWYVKGLKNATRLRQKLVQIETLDEIKKILK
ncbi:MAG: tRNA-dihydrouridine synthase [bacterium]